MKKDKKILLINKKVLVVAESIDINDSSGTKGRVALIRNLQKVGCKVKVIHYTRRETSIEKIDCEPIKENKFLFYVFSRIRRVFNRYFKFDAFKWSEYFFGFSLEFFNDSKSISKSIKKHGANFDLIITVSKGVSLRTHHAMLKYSEFYFKWAAYIHDPYPFSKFPPPYTYSQKGFKLKELFFNRVALNAKYSIFPSQLLMEWMGQFYPNVLKTGIVIPHQNLEWKHNKNIQLPSFLNTNNFNILHAGNMMKERPPMGLLEGYKLFLSKNPSASLDTKLIHVGNCNDFENKLNIYEQNLKNFHFIKSNMPFEIVNQIQKHCSVNVILESNSEISPFLPGKFPHCVYANKPILVLGPEISEVIRLLGKKYPYYAKNGDANKIAIIIENLYKLWKQDAKKLTLNRPDILDYLGIKYFENQMQHLFYHNH
jgi:hypothetical protein